MKKMKAIRDKICVLLNENAPILIFLGLLFIVGGFIYSQCVALPKEFRGGVWVRFADIMEEIRVLKINDKNINSDINDLDARVGLHSEIEKYRRMGVWTK